MPQLTILNWPISSVNVIAVVSLGCVQVMLTYLGFAPIEQPFVSLSLVSMFLYFLIHVLVMLVNLLTGYYFNVGLMDASDEDTGVVNTGEGESVKALLGLYAFLRSPLH